MSILYVIICDTANKTNYKNQNDLDETNVKRYGNTNIVFYIRWFSREETAKKFGMKTGFRLKSRRTLYAAFVHKSRENYIIQKR